MLGYGTVWSLLMQPHLGCNGVVCRYTLCVHGRLVCVLRQWIFDCLPSCRWPCWAMILLGRALPLVFCHERPARCCYLVGCVSQRVGRRLEAVPIRWAEVWAKLLLLPREWERYTQPRWMTGQLLVVSLSTNWWVLRWGWRCNQSWTFDCSYRQPSLSLSNL